MCHSRRIGHPIPIFVFIALKGSLIVWNTRLGSFYDARPVEDLCAMNDWVVVVKEAKS